MRNRSSTKSSQRFDIGAVKWYLIIRKGDIMNYIPKEKQLELFGKTIYPLESMFWFYNKYITKEETKLIDKGLYSIDIRDLVRYYLGLDWWETDDVLKSKKIWSKLYEDYHRLKKHCLNRGVKTRLCK